MHDVFCVEIAAMVAISAGITALTAISVPTGGPVRSVPVE
jgi:hypothetical protein